MGPQEPRLSSPAERERSAAKDKGTGGQYVAVCSVSNSPLIHNPFETISNKVWEVYFSKEVCSFVIIVLAMFPHIYVTWWGSSSENLGSGKYLFIAIILKSILTQSRVVSLPSTGLIDQFKNHSYSIVMCSKNEQIKNLLKKHLL